MIVVVCILGAAALLAAYLQGRRDGHRAGAVEGDRRGYVRGVVEAQRPAPCEACAARERGQRQLLTHHLHVVEGGRRG